MLPIDAEDFADRFVRSDERKTRIARHGRTARRECAVIAAARTRVDWS